MIEDFGTVLSGNFDDVRVTSARFRSPPPVWLVAGATRSSDRGSDFILGYRVEGQPYCALSNRPARGGRRRPRSRPPPVTSVTRSQMAENDSSPMRRSERRVAREGDHV